MEKTYWFGRKRWGWGYTPITWQGWTVLAVYAAIFTFGSIVFLNRGEGALRWVAFAIWAASLIYSLTLVLLAKGPKPAWQWGGPSEPEDEA